VMFAVAEHLPSASSTAAVASKIGGTAFALASACDLFAVARKLVRLREARPNIASRGLSREWHLPLAIFLHLSDLVFNNNGLVDHVLEVGVVGV
jgi:hypothetical protein